MVVTKVYLSMCGCIFGIRSSAVLARCLSRRVAACRFHPDAAGIAQDRAVGTLVDGAVDRSGHRRRQWPEDDLATLATDLEDAVAVFFADVGDVGAAGFEDP
jgi:hypothetical protein